MRPADLRSHLDIIEALFVESAGALTPLHEAYDHLDKIAAEIEERLAPGDRWGMRPDQIASTEKAMSMFGPAAPRTVT